MPIKILVLLSCLLLLSFLKGSNAVDARSGGNFSLEVALDTIATQLNVIEELLDGMLQIPEVTLAPQLRLLGRIGTKTYYRSIGLKLSWAEGLNFCRNNGLHMASIESRSEQLALQSFLTPANVNDPSNDPTLDLWIAGIWLIELPHENRNRAGFTDFYWISNGQKFGFTNWGPGQPDNYDLEHCVSVWKEQQEWNNLPCSRSIPVLCEKDAKVAC